jgi:hypothetical protein
MSVRSKRFDKYIPLFGRADDRRVALLLGELEDLAIIRKNRESPRKQFIVDDIVLNEVTTGLKNVFFTNRVETLADNAVHPEWKDFMLQLSIRLGGTRTQDANVLAILKSLQNVERDKMGSVDQFINVLLSKIANFSVNPTFTHDKNFAANNSQLDNITSIQFVAADDILHQLLQPPTAGRAVTIVGLDSTAAVDVIATGLNLARGGGGINRFIEGGLLNPPSAAGPVPAYTPANIIGRLPADSNLTPKLTAFLDAPAPNGGLPLFNELLSVQCTGHNDNDAAAGGALASALAVVRPAGIELKTVYGNRTERNTALTNAIINIWKGFIKSLDTPKEFHYKYDKFWLNRIFGEIVETPMPVAPSRFLTEEAVPTDAGKYWRKADGSLWTTDKNGKEMSVSMNSEAYQSLKMSEKCMGTGFENHGDKTCADYLNDCLSGNGIDKCKAYFDNQNFWANAHKEVDAMLPQIAMKTLTAFEFGVVSVRDETNKMNLDKVMEVPQWLIKLANMIPTKLSKDDFDKIAANGKLIGYLELLVKKINTNPSILNKGIVRSDEQKLWRKDAFKGTRLAKMGVPPRLFAHRLAPSSIGRLGEAIKSEQESMRIRLYGPAFMGGLLVGGGLIESAEETLSDQSKQTWSVLMAHYNALRAQLMSKNKDIAEVDRTKIQNLFDNLKDAEIKLTKVLLMTEKYKRLLEVHGEKDANTVLTLDHLKRFVDERNRYFNRVSKRQNDLISIIYAIAEQVQKNDPSVNISVTGNSVPASKSASTPAAAAAVQPEKLDDRPINLHDLFF